MPSSTTTHSGTNDDVHAQFTPQLLSQLDQEGSAPHPIAAVSATEPKYTESEVAAIVADRTREEIKRLRIRREVGEDLDSSRVIRVADDVLKRVEGCVSWCAAECMRLSRFHVSYRVWGWLFA